MWDVSRPKLTNLHLVFLFVIVAIGALTTAWTAKNADRTKRADLILTSRMIANSINTDKISYLAGGSDDLKNENYIRLKAQLTKIREANPKVRFLYLLRMNDNGDVIFLVDSEPADSEDYSPPGQVYEEITEYERGIFSDKIERALGPAKDRWGVWVSGFIPLLDDSGRVVAVFGMDIDAKDWNRDIANWCANPVFVTMLILLIFFVFFAIQAREILERTRLIAAKAVVEISEKKYRRVIENVQDIFCRIDTEGKIEIISPSAMSVLGVNDFKELVGTSAELVWAETKEWMDFLDKLKEKGTVQDWELEAINEKGENPVMSVTMYTVHNENGDVVGFEGIWRDITERKHAQLLVADAELRQLEEMSLASEVQKRMVTDLPAELGSMELDGVYRLRKNVGGDFYEFLQDSFGVEHLLVADICGHDLSAGLFCSAVSVMFKQAAPFADIPNEFISMLNLEFLKIAENSGKFFTAVYVQVSPDRKRARFVNAGNPPVFIVNPRGIRMQIESSGMPIGVFAEENWIVIETELEPDDVMVIFTDGITDAKNSNEEYIGVEGLARILEEIVKGNSTESLPDHLALELLQRVEAQSYITDDDVTILTIRPVAQ